MSTCALLATAPLVRFCSFCSSPHKGHQALRRLLHFRLSFQGEAGSLGGDCEISRDEVQVYGWAAYYTDCNRAVNEKSIHIHLHTFNFFASAASEQGEHIFKTIGALLSARPVSIFLVTKVVRRQLLLISCLRGSSLSAHQHLPPTLLVYCGAHQLFGQGTLFAALVLAFGVESGSQQIAD